MGCLARGEEGRCWPSPAQPLHLCPPPRVLQAGGKVALGVWQGWQPPAAGLGCVLPWGAVPSTARRVPATASVPACRALGPKRVPHPCRGPSQPRPGPGLGRGRRGWMGVEEGSCSFGAQLWGQGAWAHILILPSPPSLSCCYLDLGLFLVFPASSGMGRRRRPLILPSHHQAQLPQASQAV